MIDELPPAPDPAADSPTEFSAKAAAFVLAQRALPGQMNAAIAEFGAFAAGGVYSFPYTFDSATADADPGVGKLRLGSTTQNAATVLRVDLQMVGGTDLTNVFADLLAVTSSTKGSIRLIKSSDPTKWIIYDVTAVATPTGYRNLTVRPRSTGGGSASPFTNGEAVMVQIERNGDSGTVPGATELLASVPITAATIAVNFLNVFDSEHDSYFCTLDGVAFGGLATLIFRFAVAGALDTTSSYAVMGASGAAQINGNGATLNTGPVSQVSGSIEMSSVTYPARVSALRSWLSGFQTGGTNPYLVLTQNAMFDKPGAVVTGFGITSTAGAQFTSGTVRVYGIRKA